MAETASQIPSCRIWLIESGRGAGSAAYGSYLLLIPPPLKVKVCKLISKLILSTYIFNTFPICYAVIKRFCTGCRRLRFSIADEDVQNTRTRDFVI